MRIKGIAKLITVLALVGGVSMPVFAGGVHGARVEPCNGSAGATDRCTAFLYAGEWASVIVRSDGYTDLNVYVYDEAGNLITKDDDYSDTCVAQWRVYFTGRFLIKVMNRGTVHDNYSIEVTPHH